MANNLLLNSRQQVKAVSVVDVVMAALGHVTIHDSSTCCRVATDWLGQCVNSLHVGATSFSICFYFGMSKMAEWPDLLAGE